MAKKTFQFGFVEFPLFFSQLETKKLLVLAALIQRELDNRKAREANR